jgi:hypothetical protein
MILRFRYAYSAHYLKPILIRKQLSSNTWTVQAPRQLSQVRLSNIISEDVFAEAEPGGINAVLQTMMTIMMHVGGVSAENLVRAIEWREDNRELKGSHDRGEHMVTPRKRTMKM